MITNALNGKSLPIYGDGMQIRDWLYVEDHCSAIWEIIKNGKVGESYNIGGGNQPANIEIVQTICKLLTEADVPSPVKPYESLIKYVKDRPGHDRRYAMNIQKIARELNWQPQYDLEKGLRKTIEWYLENAEWLHAIQKRKDYKEWVGDNYKKRGQA